MGHSLTSKGYVVRQLEVSCNVIRRNRCGTGLVFEAVTDRSLGQPVERRVGDVVVLGVLPSHVLHLGELATAEVLGPGTGGVENPAFVECSDLVQVVHRGVVGVRVIVEEHGSDETGGCSLVVDNDTSADISGDPLNFDTGDGVLLVILVGSSPA